LSGTLCAWRHQSNSAFPLVYNLCSGIYLDVHKFSGKLNLVILMQLAHIKFSNFILICELMQSYVLQRPNFNKKKKIKTTKIAIYAHKITLHVSIQNFSKNIVITVIECILVIKHTWHLSEQSKTSGRDILLALLQYLCNTVHIFE